jgi:hypothetical protein
MRESMHPRRVHPAEERLVGSGLALDEVDRRRGGFVVDRLHPLPGQGAGILDGLLADLAKARLHARIVDIGGLAFQRAARTEPGLERRVLRIVRVLRLLLGIQVVEVAVELIEAVHRRQEFVSIAEMVLAELAGGVAERLQRLCDRDIVGAEADHGARDADLREAGAESRLPGDERGSACRAALLGAIIGKHHALAGNAVNIRGAVAISPKV